MPRRDTLYYDGQCGLCRRTVRLMRRLDWLGRLAYADFTALDDAELPVARERAMEGIPMLTREGTTLVGFPAFRRALLQTPLGALPALLLYVPGLSHAGRAVYNRVARNRRRNVRCEI